VFEEKHKRDLSLIYTFFNLRLQSSQNNQTSGNKCGDLLKKQTHTQAVGRLWCLAGRKQRRLEWETRFMPRQFLNFCDLSLPHFNENHCED
jgi:hypothetical protein